VAADHRAGCDRVGQAPGPSATVALVRHRGRQLDYLALGDSTLLLETRGGVSQHSDKRLARVAPLLRGQIRSRLRQGRGYDNPAHHDLVGQLVTAERAVRNTEGGYWIASHDPDAAHHALVGTCAIGTGPGEVHRLALLSDGLERAVTVLGVHRSWDELLHALVTEGPAACIDAVRKAEAGDPQGRRHPRTAATDDASGLVAEFVLVG